MPLDQALELLDRADDPLEVKRLIAKALDEKLAAKQRKEFAAPGGLIKFVKHFWDVLEPDTPFQDGWAIQAMAQHLEATASGKITRLLINVPPGACKSLLSSVFFPAWVWGALKRPGARFLCISYAAALPERDNRKMISLLLSPKFRRLYGNDFKLTKAGEELIENDRTGFKQAAGIGGTITGRRGDFLLYDDPNNIIDIESEVIRETAARNFREAASNRLNDLTRSAIIVIQQRSHEDDVSGAILDDEKPFVHLCIPLLFEDPGCETYVGDKLFWRDPRKQDGECFWPKRYPPSAIDEAMDMGPFAFAGQYQQSPEPRGGGILKREFWMPWTEADYPKCDFILASLDPAFTTKEENDYSGFTIWGAFLTKEGFRAVMLLHAARLRLGIVGPDIWNEPGETYGEWRRRTKHTWGLCETIHDACITHKVDELWIENKGPGLSVIQTMDQQFRRRRYGVKPFDPKRLDKSARMRRVEPEFAKGMVYAPFDKDSNGDPVMPLAWAEMVIKECSVAPRGRYDDLTDSTTAAIYIIRQLGWLEHREDQFLRKEEMGRNYRQPKPLYNI